MALQKQHYQLNTIFHQQLGCVRVAERAYLFGSIVGGGGGRGLEVMLITSHLSKTTKHIGSMFFIWRIHKVFFIIQGAKLRLVSNIEQKRISFLLRPSYITVRPPPWILKGVGLHVELWSTTNLIKWQKMNGKTNHMF